MSEIQDQFEYATEMVVHGLVVVRANELGKIGWELVGVYPIAVMLKGPFSETQDTRFECIFKRKVIKPKQILNLQVVPQEHPAGCQCGFHPNQVQ